MTPEPRWTKSSYSNNGGACVEVAANLAAHGTIPVRDSKDPHGPTLAFDTTAWTAFVAGIKAGDFTA
ncbi:DUF397 domain-containing protein [Streptomyces sp. AC563]|uniref:DUF397 domain-containing protein n=1 Tax=Streptomyces buecherae TaxID=2763006 RepID=UPI00164EB5BC|nr:DUF397 domain-containing protein [Streptomyces buecherae]MBC3991084.1 DUF397 domain-containing protein [Streptomyces buecherae]